MMPTLVEDDRYYFDADAAARPGRFAAKFLKHYEGRKFSGKPFTFLPWQEQVTQALFGWKRRADDLRRFREAYILTAKGSGKTPWLAAIGMYMLLADGEPGAHVMSCATDFPQAYLTLDAAKKYIAKDPQLSKVCRAMQFEIKAPAKNGQWSVLSGTAEGRHGFRPSCLLMDEAHEWPNGKLYNNLTANLTKRSQPLCLVATNAGENEHCFCWQLHERAVKAMEGSGDDTLLPVICEAGEDLDWQSEEAAAAANPSLGLIYGFDALAGELTKARESDEGEAKYRRLFLSQWQKTADGRWLDMREWAAAVASWADQPSDAPLYVGLDLAQSDDLCAAAWVYPTPDRVHVRSSFWMTEKSAFKHEQQHSVTWGKWGELGHVNIVKAPAITSKVRKQIAAEVIARHKVHPVKAVCYDRYKADETIAAIEAAGITCVPIAQGYSVSPGAHELERRLKEGSMAIEANAVLRFCAENAQAKRDDRGNLWVAKPGAKGRYAGTAWKKVDGITALVTALVEARKHSFPAAKKAWKGSIKLV